MSSQRTTKNFLNKKTNSLGLSAGAFCNLLGIDPHTPTPDYATLRRYIRRLHLLLHPDRIAGNDEAKRAQEDLKFDFRGLRDIEGYLCASESWYRSRIAGLCKMAIQDDSWVSTWNPHSLDGGDVFEPLPSFVTRMNPQQAPNPGQPASGNGNDHSHGPPPQSATSREYTIDDMYRINIFNFRPSWWVGVPPFHGAGQEQTTHALLRFIGCSPVTGAPNFGVSVAAVELRWGSQNFEAAHMTADAIVELPPFGHTPSPGSLTVQLLLKNRGNGEDVTLSWLSTAAPIHLRDLTNEWSDCPGPWSPQDPCPWTRNRMSMRIEWWYGVFASEAFGNSEIKMSYINDFLQQVREAMN
ncbi:hypothetical protein SLS55_010302 [Diplodia seriata]|uniref:J domain-containing protein n=1 Tax=Diplodia seriata TaxID=420778 RepID=A0ABR3C1A4_9PEZI